LPWRAHKGGTCWLVDRLDGNHQSYTQSERAAKLMSAAPELLEAVQAAKAFWRRTMFTESVDVVWLREVGPLIERALRKVEAGIPEEP
jgi:hypothetical protein